MHQRPTFELRHDGLLFFSGLFWAAGLFLPFLALGAFSGPFVGFRASSRTFLASGPFLCLLWAAGLFLGFFGPRGLFWAFCGLLGLFLAFLDAGLFLGLLIFFHLFWHSGPFLGLLWASDAIFSSLFWPRGLFWAFRGLRLLPATGLGAFSVPFVGFGPLPNLFWFSGPFLGLIVGC